MKKDRQENIILGIDPGFGRIGWGVIIQEKSDWQVVNYGCIETAMSDPFVDRLAELHLEIVKLIKKSNFLWFHSL